MSGRTMYVHTIEGTGELGEIAYRVTVQDENVARVDLHETAHTPSSWAELSAEIARALAIVCGPCISKQDKL